MRHVFIVNPAAGKNRRALAVVPQIEQAVRTAGISEYKIYYTKTRGDATEIALREAAAGLSVRFYACGGDGTLNEVLAGMFGFAKAQLTHVPCGSANDYVRTFSDCDFTDLTALLSGEEMLVDVLRCGKNISLNTCCMGMDADVANKMVRYKKLPFVSGPAAYILAIADVFFHKIGKNLQIRIETPDGIVERQGRYFFALAANGQYYGGGFRGAPAAMPTDGMLDFVLVRKMSRLRIPGFLKRYKAGEPLSCHIREDFRGSRMTVVCPEGAVVAVDGECISDTHMDFEILPAAVKFVFPSNRVGARLRRAPTLR